MQGVFGTWFIPVWCRYNIHLSHRRKPIIINFFSSYYKIFHHVFPWILLQNVSAITSVWTVFFLSFFSLYRIKDSSPFKLDLFIFIIIVEILCRWWNSKTKKKKFLSGNILISTRWNSINLINLKKMEIFKSWWIVGSKIIHDYRTK